MRLDCMGYEAMNAHGIVGAYYYYYYYYFMT